MRTKTTSYDLWLSIVQPEICTRCWKRLSPLEERVGERGSADKDQVIKCNAIYFLSIWPHLYSLILGDE